MSSEPTPTTGSHPRHRGHSGEAGAALLLLLPAILLLIAIRILPILNGVWQSFAEPASGGHGPHFGLGNYVFLFTKYPTFYKSVLTTLTLVIVSGGAQTLLALGMALLFAQRITGVAIMRTIALLPLAAPIAASAAVWGIIMRPQGPLNAILASIGLGEQPFLTANSQALLCISLILSWSVTGYWMTVLMAGLNDIPRPLYEAAAIDGAGPWRVFHAITLPMMRRPLLFVIVAGTVSNFLAFAPTQILTRGGPLGSTNVIMFEVFSEAYMNYDIGLASAEVVVCLIVLGALVAAQFRMLSHEG